MKRNNWQNLIDKVGVIHLVGIGGIGMSGIAEILIANGHNVQGSDLNGNYNTERLEKEGCKIFIGHKADNIAEAGVVVISTAVKEDNPEVIEARKRKIPVIKRAEMLAELMRLKISVAVSGSHGKTTTTSLTSCLFEAEGLDPTVINGGIIVNKGTNAFNGKGEYLIAEADESDETFIKIPGTFGIVTNIDPEHLDHYGNFDNLFDAFKKFVENMPFFGFTVICLDNQNSKRLAQSVHNKRIYSYSLYEAADFKAVNIRRSSNNSGYIFDIEVSDNVRGGARVIRDIYLPMNGVHNVSNATAALAVAIELGFDENTIKTGFSSFQGVKRRFTHTGEVNNILFVDDYAHHPVEIAATLATAKDVAKHREGRVFAIIQPHRYSRVKNLFAEFVEVMNLADKTYLADIYSAGEQEIEGISSKILVTACKQSQNDKISYLESEQEIPRIVLEEMRPNDILLFMGAGNITKWAYQAPLSYSDIIQKKSG